MTHSNKPTRKLSPKSAVFFISMRYFCLIKLFVLVLDPTDLWRWLTLTAFPSHSRQLFSSKWARQKALYTTLRNTKQQTMLANVMQLHVAVCIVHPAVLFYWDSVFSFSAVQQKAVSVLSAVLYLLINYRPHNCCHKHLTCTAAICWDLWSASSLFPGHRFTLTCKNFGDVLFWKKKKKKA